MNHSEKDLNTFRFVQELEFVQCLANPDYLQFLAKEKYFEDPTFKNFLSYLRYWKTLPYSTYISYPHCLRMLDALQDEEFCANLANENSRDLLRRQQGFSWLVMEQTPRDPEALHKEQKEQVEEVEKFASKQLEIQRDAAARHAEFFQKNIELIEEDADMVDEV